MDGAQLDGGFAHPAHDAARAFRAALTALAQPGRIMSIEGAEPPEPCSVAAGALLLTLCDGTTPIYLAPSHDTAALRAWITFHTGAPFSEPEFAQFALGRWADLKPLDRFPIGTSQYPDRSATLIVECEALTNTGPTLRGPGIETSAQLSLPETAAFQANRRAFPLGFDCYLTAADRLAGVPRSTRVEE